MHLFHALFPQRHSWLLVISLLLGVISIILFSAKKIRWSLACLFSSGFVLRLFMAYLDPFLHEWDERFHALVARNMMHDPFKPMLRINELVPYNYREWCCNHIWLHKQPLFMWQMALSMKIFGVSEYAIRYPGVLMGSIAILLVYRICWLATSNQTIAFMAAVIACFSYFQLELASGLYGMDQNDTAFDFYVLCSFWAYAEYLQKKNTGYALLIGLFAGSAVLNKWLIGLLVFAPWGIVVLLSLRNEDRWRSLLHYMGGLLACVAVALPWQLYIFHRYPAEASWEYGYNMKHISSVVEGHTGDYWFYINRFTTYFGGPLCYLVPAGIVLAIALRKYRTHLLLSLVFSFLLVFIFFSFVASTKVTAYMMPVASFGYIFIAISAFHAISWRNVQRYALVPLCIALALLMLDLPDITNKHDPNSFGANEWCDWKTKAYNTTLYKNFRHLLPHKIKYVLNVKDHVDLMFFNKDVDAYNWLLGPDDVKKIRDQHLPIAVFHVPGQPDLPWYLADYDSLYIIPAIFK